ncbi:MAG: PAS domain S-box protein, partial [candidate division Zixibacteria bacterium]
MKRAFWIFTAVVAIFFVAVCVAVLFVEYDIAKNALEEKVDHDLRLMAVISRGALAYSDYERVEEEILLWAESDTNVVAIRATIDGDFMLAEYRRPTPSAYLLTSEYAFVSAGGKEVRFALDYDLSEHRRHVLEFASAFLIIAGLIMTIFIYSVWRTLHRLAIRPLQTEITEREQTENKLLRSEARLNATQQLSKVGGWEWDVEKGTMFWTDETYRIHDFQPSQFKPGSTEHIERSIECYDPEDRPVIMEAFKNCTEEGKAYDLEFPLTTSKGRRIWIRTVANPVLKGDSVVKVIGNIVDITERKQWESAILDRQQKLSSIFRAAPVGIGLVIDRGIVHVNDRFCEMLGYSADELVGQNARMVYPSEEEYESVGTEEYAQIQKYGTGTVETRFRRKDGTVMDVILGSAPLDPEDLGKGVTFTALDITERKQAEEAVRIERDNLSNIFEAMEDGVYIVNQQCDIQYVNPVLTKEFGIYEGRKCYEYFHDRTEECPWCRNNDVFAGKTVHWEWSSFRNQRTYDLIDTPLKNSDGSISKLEIFRDITERKQTEEALRTSMEKFRCVSSSVPDAIVMIDNEGCISFFNKAAEKILGYTQDEVIGKPLHDTLVPKQYHESSLKGLERFRKTGEGPAIGKTLELVGKRKDGSEFPIELGVSAVELGGKWHAVGIIRDITERKQAEAALQERLQFETLMAALSATFVNLPLDKFDTEIQRWLHRIAEFCGADHCSLWQWSDGER